MITVTGELAAAALTETCLSQDLAECMAMDLLDRGYLHVMIDGIPFEPDPPHEAQVVRVDHFALE